MIVQIYEIQTVAEAEVMISLGVDHMGSVLLSGDAWRDAELKRTVATVQAAGRKSSLIPLFGDMDLIAEALEYHRPDIVHFCDAFEGGHLDSRTVSDALARQRMVRGRFPHIRIMRSIPIGTHGNGDAFPSLALAALFEPFSDWFLTDTLIVPDKGAAPNDQPVRGYVGITGRVCDWEVARRLVAVSRIPVVLAGGIGPDNVRDAIRRVGPAGVDSCTLTNATDARGVPVRFRKDPGKVAALVKAARDTHNRSKPTNTSK